MYWLALQIRMKRHNVLFPVVQHSHRPQKCCFFFTISLIILFAMFVADDVEHMYET